MTQNLLPPDPPGKPLRKRGGRQRRQQGLPTIVLEAWVIFNHPSQRKAAKALGISESVLRKYLGGTAIPTSISSKVKLLVGGEVSCAPLVPRVEFRAHSNYLKPLRREESSIGERKGRVGRGVGEVPGSSTVTFNSDPDPDPNPDPNYQGDEAERSHVPQPEAEGTELREMARRDPWVTTKYYAWRFGVEGAKSHGTYASLLLPSKFSNKKRRTPEQWIVEHDRLNYSWLRKALQGRHKNDVRDVKYVGHLTFDCDSGHVKYDKLPIEIRAEIAALVPQKYRDGFTSIMTSMRGPEKRAFDRAVEKVMRRWRASVTFDTLTALRSMGLPVVPIRTKGGHHLVVPLSEEVDPERAARMTLGIAERLPKSPWLGDKGVEGFPKQYGTGVAHCSLPLTGSSRICLDDLETNKFGRRKDDLIDLFMAPMATPELVESILGSVKAPGGVQDSVSVGEVALEAVEVQKAAGGAPGQKYRGEFVLAMLEVLVGGLDQGGSRDGLRRAVAGMRYSGLSEEQVQIATDVWFERPIHRANHCQTSRGRYQLRRQVKAQLRWFAKGLAAGRCWVGGMRSREVVAALSDLLKDVGVVVKLNRDGTKFVS